MSGKHYTDEFKVEALRQITEGGYPVQKTVAITTEANPQLWHPIWLNISLIRRGLTNSG